LPSKRQRRDSPGRALPNSGNGGYSVSTASGVNAGGNDFGNFKNVASAARSGKTITATAFAMRAIRACRLDHQRRQPDCHHRRERQLVTYGWPGHVCHPRGSDGTALVELYPNSGNGDYSSPPPAGVNAGGNDFGNFKTWPQRTSGKTITATASRCGRSGPGRLDINVGNQTATTDVNGNWSLRLARARLPSKRQRRTALVELYPNLGNGGYSVSTASGVNAGGNDFGNFKNVALSGTKWEDHNGNGIRDAGDQGLAGWTINVGNQTATTWGERQLVT